MQPQGDWKRTYPIRLRTSSIWLAAACAVAAGLLVFYLWPVSAAPVQPAASATTGAAVSPTPTDPRGATPPPSTPGVQASTSSPAQGSLSATSSPATITLAKGGLDDPH